jgi:ATP-dependent exoDNAse (exonuclease V) beta subunit
MKKTKLQEVKDEYLRLFYVAMTRAKRLLIVVGNELNNSSKPYNATNLPVAESGYLISTLSEFGLTNPAANSGLNISLNSAHFPFNHSTIGMLPPC